jgi:HSP20 family molecular chaperone IbpA
MTMPPRIPSEVIHSAAPSPRPSRRVSSSTSPQSSSSNCCPHMSPSTPPPPPTNPTSYYPHISSSNSCPYIPFLSSSDAPPDCEIDIQAHSNLYYILVNLPGFSSQDITLATKRRRILHLVADKWGEGGGLLLFSRPFLLSLIHLPGHFEKKIVFGYDADLTRVRAEFNGDLLTITIPRRATSDLLH